MISCPLCPWTLDAPSDGTTLADHPPAPSWQTSSPTFVGALEKGRRHLALLSWPTGEFRYDYHPVCLDKALTATPPNVTPVAAGPCDG